MNPEKTKIRYEASETKINVRQAVAIGGVAAVAAGGLFLATGGEDQPSAERLAFDKGTSEPIKIAEKDTVNSLATKHAQEVNPNLTATQQGQINASADAYRKANGIPQPGDTFMLNIGEYDGKPGVDVQVTRVGEDPKEVGE